MIVIGHVGEKSGFNYVGPLGTIGVTIFLFCSGYGLNESYKLKGLKGFIKNRLIKVLLPYWLILTVYIIAHPFELNPIQIIESFFLLYTIPYMWFIKCILLWYVVFYFAKLLLKDNSIYLLFLIGIVVLITFKDIKWSQQAFSFILGVLISQININTKTNTNEINIISIVSLISCACFFVILKELHLSNYYFTALRYAPLLVSSAWIAILIVYRCIRVKSFRTLSLVGSISYEIYLIHTLLISLVRHNYIILVFFIVLIVIGSICLHVICEQISIFLIKDKNNMQPTKVST